MKISCDREKLFAAFQTVATVVPTRSPKPILQSIKLEISETSATLVATDLEQGIRLEVSGVEIEVAGSAILPHVKFGSILRESTDKTLRIESDAQGILVEGDRSEFRLPGKDANEFPLVPEFGMENYFEVSARLFRELIHRTILAVDNESGRYALGGVLLDCEEEKIIAVGTDGRRLAKMEGPVISVGQPQTGDNMIIVPARAMQLVERALSDTDAEIQFAARSNEFLLKSQRATIHSRLLEGRFPRWRDVFPVREGTIRIEIPIGPFHAAVRQAAIITSEESRGIDFTFGGGTLLLAGQTADVGQARVELPIGYDGENVSIMLDPRYMIDFLRVLDPEKTFALELKDSESAAVSSTDDGYSYVIMPLSRDRLKL